MEFLSSQNLHIFMTRNPSSKLNKILINIMH